MAILFVPYPLQEMNQALQDCLLLIHADHAARAG
jgi:hypothetical protein